MFCISSICIVFIINRITKVEKKYYADTEDAYEMMKFFKLPVEEKLMKKVLQPITSTFPGATYPLIEYPIHKKKVEDENAPSKPEEKKAEPVPTTATEELKAEKKPEEKTEAKTETKTEAKKEAKTEGKKKKKHKKK